jgi:hypothetical protein
MKELLEKTRKWVEAEIKKAQAPFADPFLLTSLNYALKKGGGATFEEVEDALALLHSVAATERQHGTYDVATPYGALFLLDRALATRS